MLMPRLSHGMGTAMDGLTTVATGMERDLLMLSQGMATTDGPTTVATGTERGLPTLSQPPMLMRRLSHGIMVVTAMDGLTTVATITERDLQTPNQLQLLMPSLSHGGTDTTDTH